MSQSVRKLGVASSPHVSSSTGTRSLMFDVCIALVPALCFAIWAFGPRALAMTVVSMLACGLFEWGYRKLMHQSNTLPDMSVMITGILLAFVCPPGLPYWILIIGDFFAVIVVKQLFGGLGKNFMNPALGGRAFLMLCYPVAMTTWAATGTNNWLGLLSGNVTMKGVDVVTGATPLSADFMHQGVLPLTNGGSVMDMLQSMFVGNIGGSLGETSALMLILGGAYLVFRGVIKLRIPVSFIGTVAVLTFLFPQGGNDRLTWMLAQLLTGGLMLGAFFMATDYVTSPTTPRGELIFGVGCGLLTVFIRYFGGYPEGVSYAILLMNICVWIFDELGKPSRFGLSKELKEKQKAAQKAAKEAGVS